MNSESTYSQIKTQIISKALVIMIDRESKMNALNITVLQEIKAAVEDANNNDDIRGIIITGKGTKAFAAGADIAEFSEFSVEQAAKMSRDGHEVLNTIEGSAKPVIAAVNGYALGGGCELALSCHMRMASPNAVFGQPEVNLGVPPGYGGTQRLAQIIGKGLANEMLITTQNMDAGRALETGLVNKVVTQDELIPTCVSLVDKIAKKSPAAIARVIRCVNDLYTDGVNGMETEIKEFSEAFQTPDFVEGTSAFLEKRKPSFD